MIIRATILVFALMFYIMIAAGGHITRRSIFPGHCRFLAERVSTLPRFEKDRQRRRPPRARKGLRLKAPSSIRRRTLIRISAYNHPEVAAQSARSPEGKIDFALLDETALQGLTYAAAEKAITEQLTGKSAAHGPQMKVRQALILGCGLMMREAQSMEVESRGKYEKLDLHRPLAHSSPSISVPHVAERTY